MSEEANKRRAAESIPINEAYQAFGENPTKRIDRAAGLVRGVTIFNPKPTPDGKFFKSDKQLYDPSFFDNAIPVLEGALAMPRHARRAASGQDEDQSPFDAKGMHTNVRRDGNKIVSDFKPFKQHADEVFEMCENAWPNMAFSIKGDATGYYVGQQRIATRLFDRPRPTVDFVKDGGAALHIFESAAKSGGSTGENAMTPEEIKSMTDEAALKAAELTDTKFKEFGDKLVKIEESMKTNKTAIDEAAKKQESVEKEQQAAGLRLKIREAIATAKIGANQEGDHAIVLGALPSEKWEGKIKEHKTFLAQFVNPVTGMGGNAGDTKKVEVSGKIDIREAIRSIGGGLGFAVDREKDTTAAKAWMGEIGSRCSDFSDKTEETNKLRVKLIESYGRVGLSRLYQECYGERPDLGCSHMRIPVVEANDPLASTGFSALNSTVLASIMILRVDATGGRVADLLSTPYPTNLDSENIPGFNEPSDLELTAEGAEKPTATLTNKYVGLVHVDKYAKKVVLTREAVFYDRTGQVMDNANRIAENAVYHREKSMIYGMADQPGYECFYIPSGDGKTVARAPLWTNGASGYNLVDNILEANALSATTGWQNIEMAALWLRTFKDSLGRLLTDNDMQPLEILAPSTLTERLRHIKGAQLFETNSGSGANIRFDSTAMATFNVYFSPHLNNLDPQTWYCSGAGGFARQFVRKVIFPLEVVPIPQSEISAVIKDLVGGVAVMYAEKMHARENRRVIKNIPGATS